MVDLISAYSTQFSALNTVTLSRWETGTTNPTHTKKKTLLHFLASTKCFSYSPACHTLMMETYEELYEPLSTVFTRNYQYLIGNFPEFKVDFSSLQMLNDFEHKEEHLEHIVDIETVTNVEGYYSVEQNRLKALCEHPSSFAVICERKRQHLGHFIMFKIKNSVAENIVYHRRNEYTLTLDDLCDVKEHGTYYVHALYGKNPRIAALLNVKAYLYLFENIQYVDNVAIFSSRKDGVLLTKDYGIELVAKGKDETFGYVWHGLLSPVEDILFSDTVVKLIF